MTSQISIVQKVDEGETILHPTIYYHAILDMRRGLEEAIKSTST
jgi:hypothetical protein